MADGLRTLILGLYDKRLTRDGRGVNFAALDHVRILRTHKNT